MAFLTDVETKLTAACCKLLGLFGLSRLTIQRSIPESPANIVVAHRIMAVTGLAVFSGDLILGFLVRFIGTLIGLVLGMLAWYIGNGKGSNPYGTIAALIVILAPVVYARVNIANPGIMAFPLMIGVTMALVVGYSWVDSHLPLLVNSGIGVDVAWKRA